MSSGVKIKPDDEMYSMFLVPKRLYYSLMKNIEDDETKKQLISMDEKPETTNYIENAIKFKNLQYRQKMNQTGDKLYCFGPDKLPNVMSVARTNSSMGRTYQSLSRSTSAQIPQREEMPNVMSPGLVDSSMDRTYRSLSTLTPAQIPQQEESILPSTPIIEREHDTERSSSPERSKSPNKTKFSTPVGAKWRQWQDTPIVEVMTQRNSRGRFVCPIYDCRKQYINKAQLGRHLLRDHYKDMSMRDRKTIKGMTSGPDARTKSPNKMDYSIPVETTPVATEW